MRYKVAIIKKFAAAHYIPGHKGKCKNLHGHTYKAKVTVSSNVLDELGMVIDFETLKKYVNEIIHQFDHQVLNDLLDFKEKTTTAENLAEIISKKLTKKLSNLKVLVESVEIWESDDTVAIYSNTS